MEEAFNLHKQLYHNPKIKITFSLLDFSVRL